MILANRFLFFSGYICYMRKIKKSVLLLFFGLFALSFSGIGQNADIRILRHINLDRNTGLDPTMKFVSNSEWAIGAGIPIVLISSGLIKHDSVFLRKSLVVGASMIIASGIASALKYSVNRPRPFVTYPDIQKISPAGSPSFPSGHTSSAFALATSLTLQFPKWYVAAPAYVWAGTVGYSRMHLGVHYPSDVLAGALVGAGSAWIGWKLNKILFQH